MFTSTNNSNIKAKNIPIIAVFLLIVIPKVY